MEVASHEFRKLLSNPLSRYPEPIPKYRRAAFPAIELNLASLIRITSWRSYCFIPDVPALLPYFTSTRRHRRIVSWGTLPQVTYRISFVSISEKGFSRDLRLPFWATGNPTGNPTGNVTICTFKCIQSIVLRLPECTYRTFECLIFGSASLESNYTLQHTRRRSQSTNHVSEVPTFLFLSFPFDTSCPRFPSALIVWRDLTSVVRSSAGKRETKTKWKKMRGRDGRSKRSVVNVNTNNWINPRPHARRHSVVGEFEFICR